METLFINIKVFSVLLFVEMWTEIVITTCSVDTDWAEWILVHMWVLRI